MLKNLKLNAPNSAFEQDSTFFVAVVSIILGLTYYLARFGFGNDSFLSILTVWGVAFFILFLPSAVGLFQKKPEPWYLSAPAILLYGLSIVFLTGFLAFFLNLSLVVVFLGYIFFLIFILRYFSFTRPRFWLIILALAIIFSLFAIGAYWGNSYQSPLFFEKIVLGRANLDTLFHTTVASMIKTYGVPSTGLDGLPYLNYHWGSHFLFAQIAKLLGSNLLDFYNRAFPIIFIPFIVRSFLYLVRGFRKLLSVEPKRYLISWPLLILGFTGILPIALFARFGGGTDTIVMSESYVVACSLAFLLLSLIFENFEKITRSKPLVSGKNILTFLILLPAIIGLIGLAKISLLFLLMAAFLYLFFRLKLFSRWLGFLAIFASALASILIYKIADRSGGPMHFEFLSYVKTFVDSDLRMFYFTVTYFWVFLYLFLRLRDLRIANLVDLKLAFAKRSFIELEILLAIAFVGLFPGLFLNIAGGSAGYFSDLQRWLAIALVIALTPKVIPSLFNIPAEKLHLRNIKLSGALLTIFIVPFVISSGLNIRDSFVSFLSDNISVRNQILLKDGGFQDGYILSIKRLIKDSQKSFFQAILAVFKAPQEQMDRGLDQEYNLAVSLKNLDSITPQEKKKTAVFISQDNSLYWNMLSYKNAPFAATSLTEMAMIDGVRPFIPDELSGKEIKRVVGGLSDSQKQFVESAYRLSEQETSTDSLYSLRTDLSDESKSRLYDAIAPYYYDKLFDYGYSYYQKPTEENFKEKTETDAGLCAEARSKGFDRVIVVAENENQTVNQRAVECHK